MIIYLKYDLQMNYLRAVLGTRMTDRIQKELYKSAVQSPTLGLYREKG